MNLNEFVTEMELSKKLMPLLAEHQTYFVYAYHDHTGEHTLRARDQSYHEKDVPAWTSEELSAFIHGFMNITVRDGEWWVYFSPENGTDNSYTFKDINLANALALYILAQHTEGEFLEDDQINNTEHLA